MSQSRILIRRTRHIIYHSALPASFFCLSDALFTLIYTKAIVPPNMHTIINKSISIVDNNILFSFSCLYDLQHCFTDNFIPYSTSTAAIKAADRHSPLIIFFYTDTCIYHPRNGNNESIMTISISGIAANLISLSNQPPSLMLAPSLIYSVRIFFIPNIYA